MISPEVYREGFRVDRKNKSDTIYVSVVHVQAVTNKHCGQNNKKKISRQTCQWFNEQPKRGGKY